MFSADNPAYPRWLVWLVWRTHRWKSPRPPFGEFSEWVAMHPDEFARFVLRGTTRGV